MGHSFLVVSAGKADNVRMTSAGSGAWGELADSYLGLGVVVPVWEQRLGGGVWALGRM